MGVDELKIKFINWLNERTNTDNSESYESLSYEDTLSLFNNNVEEFKKYLVSEFGADESIFSKSISEIMTMEFSEDGLVENNNDENDDSLETVLKNAGIITSGSDDSKESEYSDEVNCLLDILYENKTAIKALDTDEDGVLSEEEKEAFEEYSKGYDDSDELTETAIQRAYADIMSGEFSYDNDLSQKDAQDSEFADNAEDDVSNDTTSNTSSASSSPGSGSVSSESSSTSLDNTGSSDEEKTLENMDKSKLTAELNKAESDLGEKKNILTLILNGEDDNIKTLQKAVDDTYNTYLKELEAVDEDMAQQVNELKETIDAKQAEIDAKELEISNQECTVSSAQNSYNNAQTTTKTLQEQLTALKSTDTSNMDDEKKTEVTSNISALETEVSQAKENEEEKKQEWEDAKDILEELKNEKTELESSEDESNPGLSMLNTQMDELEVQILEENPQVEKSLTAYKNAQDNLTEYKTQAVSNAQNDINNAQDYYNEVKTALSNCEDDEKVEEYSVSSSDLPDDLFDGTLKGQEDYIAQIAEEYGIEPEFVAAIMAFETGYGTSDLCTNSNNPGGLRASSLAVGTTSSNFAIFDSIETGIEAVIKNLAGYTKYSGVSEVSIDYVEQIGSIYCVGGNWAENVTSIYNKIKAMEA